MDNQDPKRIAVNVVSIFIIQRSGTVNPIAAPTSGNSVRTSVNGSGSKDGIDRTDRTGSLLKEVGVYGPVF